mgnify:CR=1 FL=1
MKFCTSCGNSVSLQIPAGDDRERFVCSSCEYVHYINPRIIVGCLPVYEGRVLLCKRAIEPRRNYWTLPAGFMENGETTPEGAARTLVADVPLGTGDTPYATLGDWLGWVSLAGFAASIILMRVGNARRRAR